MKIVEMPPYYLPEQISSTHLTSDLTEAFVEQGFTIENYVPSPCRGLSTEEIKKYSKIKYEELYGGKVKIFRFPMWREGRNPILRAIRYVITNMIQEKMGSRAENVDIIIGGSTPPIQGLMCGRVARKLSKKNGKKVPFLYLLQDVFPDSLVTTGLAKENGILWKIGRHIEDKVYRNADKIIVISNKIKENIINKGVSSDKIDVVSNWIDTENVTPIKRRNNKLFDEFEIDKSKFIVCYAGNLGAAQGAGIIVDAAKSLQYERQIQFVIFGRGNDYAYIKNAIDGGLNNVILLPVLPQERISEVYSLGDINLITCKKGIGASGLPSKLWSIMACNGRIVASFDTDSELAQVIKDSNSGICIEPENAELLSDAIFLEYVQKNDTSISNGRKYVLEHASKKICVNKYVDIIVNMLADNYT